MSWIVEQSENTSTVNVDGDTITCTKEGHYGSPINVLYKDSADQNGEYFWQVEFKELDTQHGGSASVGVTSEQSFQSGWKLKAMKYLGNLSDGSALLVQSFGDRIKQGDKVGILLQLTDVELKMYIFHNDQPLGLAFHMQSPYRKPLYPVVSFNTNGKVIISRSQQIPSVLDRTSLRFVGVEGKWKVVEYLQHPECVSCVFNIKRTDQNQHTYSLHTRVVNVINCGLEYNPTSNEWKSTGGMSTLMGGSPEEMKKERVVSSLMSRIQNLKVQGEEQLIIETNDGEQVQLERFTVEAPSPYTKNILS